MVTIANIVAAESGRDMSVRIVESAVFVPVLGQKVPVVVDLDPERDTISARQVNILNRLLDVLPARLVEIKQQLFERWEEYDIFYTDEVDFDYESPEDAFAASEIRSVRLSRIGSENGTCAELRYRVAWDPEHGAQILYDRDEFRWCI